MKILKFILFAIASMLVLGLGSSCTKTGCTDHNAINFAPKADLDDGSCLVFGCIDPTAINFNHKATNDDGSCVYEFPEGTVGFYTSLDVNDILLTFSGVDTLGYLTEPVAQPATCGDSNVILITKPIIDPVGTTYRLQAYQNGFLIWFKDVEFFPGKCTTFLLN